MDSEEDFGHLDEDLDDLAPPRYKTDSRYGPYSSNSSSSSSGGNGQHHNEESASSAAGMKKNLNMMSAFTHVGGDTIRTISVLTAATVSLLSGIDGDICDAWAAIAVTISSRHCILISQLPHTVLLSYPKKTNIIKTTINIIVSQSLITNLALTHLSTTTQVSLTILAMTGPLMMDIYSVACSYSDEQDSRGVGYSPIKTKEPIL